MRSIHLVRSRLVVAGLIALAASLLVGYLAASIFARRIRRLERAADRIASGDFNEPVVDPARDELGQLAAAFERMRQRLAQLEHARREFIANASHELRTPLFSLGGFLELMADEELDAKTQAEFTATMREQVARLTKLATELLDLSRLDAGRLTVERERLDLDALASVLAEEFRAVARSTGHQLSVRGIGPTEGVGDAERALQIGRILVENALVHTPPGTPVRLGTARRDGSALLTVEDEGPGIPADHAGPGLRALLPPRGGGGIRQRSRACDRQGAGGADGRFGGARRQRRPNQIHPRATGFLGRVAVFTRKRTPGRTVATVSRMRLPALAVAIVVAAALGGGAALGIGKGVGWLDQGTKTVVVRAQGAQPVALPASATSKASPLPGKGFDPERIFADRSPGVVTIFAYFGDPGPSTQISQGSGFVISPKGYVLTNSHVITNAGEGSRVQAAEHLFVEFADGDRVEAKVVGWDLYDDVGLLRLDPNAHRLSPVPLGESASVVVGEPVAAIGSPLGNENTLTVGVVSAIHRSIDALTVRLYNIVDAIQTDAPITHGNSGGPLFDARGRVIGINAQIRSANGTGNDSGIGFAVPIDAAKFSVAQLIAKGEVTYAYVGITTETLTPSLARALGYKVDHGALIVTVKGGSPADATGLRGGIRDANVLGRTVSTGGDVIVAIDGKPVNGADDVVRFVSFSLRPKDVAVLTIVKPGGQRKKVAVTLAERRLPAG